MIFRTEPDVLEKWDAQWGDRQTELVMIGIEMERDMIEDELDQCLLSDEEMQADWGGFDNPLPWPVGTV